MNGSLTADYLRSIIGSLSFGKRLLVWDAYKCHTSKATRRETKKMNLFTAVIPGGCTKFIQAPDVVWNAPFKSRLRLSYDTWPSEPAVHTYTRGGNMKPPPRSLLCEWIKEAWSSISEETIRKSFLCCAITANIDGSDDDQIHCFKAGQPCEAGRSELRAKMEKGLKKISMLMKTPSLVMLTTSKQKIMKPVLRMTPLMALVGTPMTLDLMKKPTLTRLSLIHTVLQPKRTKLLQNHLFLPKCTFFLI